MQVHLPAKLEYYLEVLETVTFDEIVKGYDSDGEYKVLDVYVTDYYIVFRFDQEDQVYDEEQKNEYTTYTKYCRLVDMYDVNNGAGDKYERGYDEWVATFESGTENVMEKLVEELKKRY